MPISHLSFTQKAWRLSPMYLCYFVLFGTFVPYIARFLTANGLTEQQASVIVAVVNLVNVFAPFMFSYLADKSGKRMTFIRIGYVGIGSFYFLSMFGSGFWFYMTVFGLFGVFLSAVLPQMEAVTLAVLGKQKHRYGQIRLWGSIGFVIVVWLIGFLLDVFSVKIIAMIGTGFSVLMFLSTFLIPEKSNSASNVKTTTSEAINFPVQWSQVVVLLVVVVLWQFGMAPYNTFFDLYMKGHGNSGSMNGFLISFGSLCEIIIFIYISKMFIRFSERSLMTAALFLTSIRWLVLYLYGDNLLIVILSQTLHAVTFGVVHSVAIHRIGHLFPESRAGFGQGLYVAFSIGLGLFIGNLLAGWLWTGSGFVYLQGAMWTLLAMVIAWFGFKDSSSQRTEG